MLQTHCHLKKMKKAGWNRNLEIIDTIGYNKLKMLTAFISTIPGIPVIYYGDEIGMIGLEIPIIVG